jgi:hypothetical protein
LAIREIENQIKDRKGKMRKVTNQKEETNFVFSGDLLRLWRLVGWAAAGRSRAAVEVGGLRVRG